MNHNRQPGARALCGFFHACHPERNLATSEANRQVQSKDPVLPEGSCGTERNFRIAVRFLDEQNVEILQHNS